MHDSPMRWTGGANIPAPIGRLRAARLNATWPLAELTVDEGRVRLRIRLVGALWRRFGTGPLDWSAAEVAEVFPCRGRFGTGGVGIRTVAAGTSYFWTGEGAGVLEDCRRAGFTVTHQVRPADYSAPPAA